MAITVNCAVLPWYPGNAAPAPGSSCSGLKPQECGGRWLQARRDRHVNFKSNDANSHNTARPGCRMRQGELPVVQVVVSAMTELLRALTKEVPRSSPSPPDAAEEISDPLRVLAADYERSYFVTGELCSALYRDDCVFVDPTISFSGKETYKRNLKLLVPFLVDPSVELLSMAESHSVAGPRDGRLWFEVLPKAGGPGRTYVKLPWMPFINVDGSTVYDLDATCPPRVTRHEERWSVPAGEAIRQMFVPSDRKW